MPWASQAKKLVLILVIFASMTRIIKEAQEVIFDCISYIHYSVQFRKDKSTIQTLFNSDSKVNAMTPAYATKLGLKVWKTDVGAQKIDGFLLAIHKMIITFF